MYSGWGGCVSAVESARARGPTARRTPTRTHAHTRARMRMKTGGQEPRATGGYPHGVALLVPALSPSTLPQPPATRTRRRPETGESPPATAGPRPGQAEICGPRVGLTGRNRSVRPDPQWPVSIHTLALSSMHAREPETCESNAHCARSWRACCARGSCAGGGRRLWGRPALHPACRTRLRWHDPRSQECITVDARTVPRGALLSRPPLH